MKTIKHLMLGLVASLLFAAGFARAADRVDLLVQGLNPDLNNNARAGAVPCTAPCGGPHMPEGS